MSLNTLKTRLKYRGGITQKDRMIKDKLTSLKGALDCSYQSAIAILQDGREFQCLINPNKISMELDDKMLSIPFENICLTSNKIEQTNIQCGQVLEWKETGTHWLVYSQHLQELAYFKGLMRQCSGEPIEIDGQKYWYYLKGPDDKSIDWQKTKNLIFNNLNYTVEIYISNDQRTKQFFQRFKKCKLQGKTFEVQAVDDVSINGILLVYLKEYYVNVWEKEPELPPEEPEFNPNDAYLLGEFNVYPYDIKTYTFGNLVGGKWELSNNKAKIISQDQQSLIVEIVSGKSGSVDLIYKLNNTSYFSKEIKILSL